MAGHPFPSTALSTPPAGGELPASGRHSRTGWDLQVCAGLSFRVGALNPCSPEVQLLLSPVWGRSLTASFFSFAFFCKFIFKGQNSWGIYIRVQQSVTDEVSHVAKMGPRVQTLPGPPVLWRRRPGPAPRSSTPLLPAAPPAAPCARTHVACASTVSDSLWPREL